MKKILLSGGMIVLVGALVAGATIAFYNDTETSAGNIFTAGSIDLKVDHLKQTYNGDDCKTCSLTLYSGDGGADVVAGSNTVITTFPFPAVLVTPTSITTQYWTTHPTARWIWASPATLVGDDGSLGNITYTFEHDFSWWGDAVDVNLVFDVAADNQYEILLNGVSIATGLGSAEYTTLDTVAENAFLAQVNPGENTLTFIVTNLVNTPGNNTPLNNPGGLLYYLTITRDQEDCDANSAFQQACRLWTEKDLGNGDTFFSFGDVKPGDWGTNVISLHVDDNEAYACMLPMDVEDLENTCNDAESKANDPSCPDEDNDGELGSQLSVVVWSEEGTADGEHQSGEVILYQGPINTLLTDKLTVPQGSTGYVGLAWCAGSIPEMEDANGAVECEASGMNNQAQSDSFAADLLLYAVQSRNNTGFSCSNIPTGDIDLK